jgi:hypothetical protein
VQIAGIPGQVFYHFFPRLGGNAFSAFCVARAAEEVGGAAAAEKKLSAVSLAVHATSFKPNFKPPCKKRKEREREEDREESVKEKEREESEKGKGKERTEREKGHSRVAAVVPKERPERERF